MGAPPIVVILAAGLGTRMRSERAKVLHEVAGRPLIEWAVDTARGAGAGRVVAVLGHQAARVRAHLDARYGDGAVAYAHQREPKGTGHAVMAALEALEGEDGDRVVAVTSADVPLLPAETLASTVSACEGAAGELALVSARAPRPMRYGRIVRGASGEVERVVEDADATPEEREIDEINAGFYAVRLSRLREDLSSLSADNAQGELYLTDLVARAASRGRVAAIEAPYDDVAGVNDRVDLAGVEALFQARRRRDAMRGGATLPAPDQVYFDAASGPLGRDVWIGPGVHIRGQTRIGDDCRIEGSSVLIDADVGAGAVVGPLAVIEGARVEPGEIVEPLSRRTASTARGSP